MREILFRGKQIKDGKWIEGYYCPKPYSHFPCEPTIFPFETINKDWHGERVDPETVGQYTGLTDKNGRKIFEGDIILYHHKVKKLVPCEDATQEEILHHGLDPESGFGLAYRPKRTIRYKGNVTVDPICGTDLNLNNNCQWWRCENDGQLTSVEIIGNIYDNPELLEGS